MRIAVRLLRAEVATVTTSLPPMPSIGDLLRLLQTHARKNLSQNFVVNMTVNRKVCFYLLKFQRGSLFTSDRPLHAATVRRRARVRNRQWTGRNYARTARATIRERHWIGSGQEILSRIGGKKVLCSF